MTFSLGAKRTKPGSKAGSKAGRSRQTGDGTPARVPVGTLHYIDLTNQPHGSSMFDAICGETYLVAVDGAWDDPFPNDRCPQCADAEWTAQFNEMQTKLLQ